MRPWILIVFLAVSSLPAYALTTAEKPEQLYWLTSTLWVQKDSSVVVVERIVLEAGGRHFKYGFTRDIPTIYEDDQGRQHQIRLIKAWVSLDGRPECLRVEEVRCGKRLHVGRPGHPVEPGRHVYNLAYRIYSPIGLFRDHDELYWNVSGDAWPVPIQGSFAAIRIPGNTDSVKFLVDAYTGPEGAKQHNWRIDHICGGGPLIAITKPLRPHERFAVVVKWPKGMVRRATPADVWAWWWHDNQPALIRSAWLAGAVLVVGICSMWLLVKRRRGRNAAPNG
jgi:hypothetical protein